MTPIDGRWYVEVEQEDQGWDDGDTSWFNVSGSEDACRVVFEAIVNSPEKRIRAARLVQADGLTDEARWTREPDLPAGTRGKAQRNGRTLGSYLVNGDPVYAANALEAARTWVCHRDSRRFELTVASRRGGGFVEVRWSSGASVIDVQRLSQVGVSGWRSRRRAAGLPDDFAGMALNADNLPA